MTTAKVLLLKHIEGLGSEGDQVKVRSGYARNFLLPKKYALSITHANKKRIEALSKACSIREAKELSNAQEIASKLKKITLTIKVKTGPSGKLFGSVSAQDLATQIAIKGIVVPSKKQIHIPSPVKTLGDYSASIKLHPEIVVNFKFAVVSEELQKPQESKSTP